VHDFGVGNKTPAAAKEALEQQIVDLLEEDDDMAATWEDYCERVLRGETDPTKHTLEQLQGFMAQAFADEGEGDDGAADTGPSSETLKEQVRQLTSYSEELRDAWNEFCQNGEDSQTALADREDPELLEFLSAQGIRPWKGGRAQWEVVSSLPWWGSDSSDTSYVHLAEATIRRVVPDMLTVEKDDENGAGAILVFLPGFGEIKLLAELLEKSPDADKLWVLRMHSQVTGWEQQQIFEPADEGKVKVILATNIAESSVTINDVRVIVDAGLHREISYDPKRRMSYLETNWICQSNAVQRKGRAGRVREGQCYRLYTRDQFEVVPWRPAPEMQRCNLAQTCLQCIALNRDPRDFLADAPDPPVVASVEAAMAELTSIEAIREAIPHPKMLPIGKILCRLPLEPLLGRAMILGTLFGVPEMTAGLLAVSAARSPFNSPPDFRQEARACQREFCSWSDTLASLRALCEYEQIYKDKGESHARRWCDHYFLSAPRLLSLSRIKYQLVLDVQRSGLLNSTALEGLDPDEWFYEDEEDEEGEEDEKKKEDEYSDADGTIFEAKEVNPSGLAKEDWIQELKNSNREIENEPLLVGILCAAYPTNVAFREKPAHRDHKTKSSAKAAISIMSVNSSKGREEGLHDMEIPTPSWWLYSDLRMYNSQVLLLDTTMVSPWQLAIFGGLRAKGEEELEFDNWITLQCDTPEEAALVRRLRKEVREAILWVSIATSWDKVAQANVQRAKTLFRVLGCVLTQQEIDQEDLDYMNNWKLPVLEEGGYALEADEEDREEVEEQLFKKTVVELKVLLKELNCKVTGRKSDLVERCADALIYGDDEEAKEKWKEEMGGHDE